MVSSYSAPSGRVTGDDGSRLLSLGLRCPRTERGDDRYEPVISRLPGIRTEYLGLAVLEAAAWMFFQRVIYVGVSTSKKESSRGQGAQREIMRKKYSRNYRPSGEYKADALTQNSLSRAVVNQSRLNVIERGKREGKAGGHEQGRGKGISSIMVDLEDLRGDALEKISIRSSSLGGGTSPKGKPRMTLWGRATEVQARMRQRSSLLHKQKEITKNNVRRRIAGLVVKKKTKILISLPAIGRDRRSSCLWLRGKGTSRLTISF